MELTDKSICVTGGAGFIGSHLVDALINESPSEIVVIDNMFLGKESNLNDAKSRFDHLKILTVDASDYKAMKDIFSEYRFDVVFDLAVVPLPASLVDPKYCTEVNIGIVNTLCELQRLGFYKTLIHFSSSEVYGSAVYEPMDESHPLGALTPYAASKGAGDLIVLSYYKTFNTDCAIVRPFNNYGPRQNEKSYAGVIPLTIKRIMKGEPPVIYGDGLQTRDYIYVTDTARMAIEVYKNTATRGKILNIGSGKETTILSLITTITKTMNYDKEIVFEKDRPGDVRKHIADVILAKEILGFKPEVTLDEGMQKTIDWYKENINMD